MRPAGAGGVPFHAALLDAIFAARDARRLLRAHAAVTVAGAARHDLLRTKLSACYARCGRLREARHILAAASGVPVHAALLDSIFAARDARRLLRAHAAVTVAGAARHDLLQTKLSACYARCGRLREARHIFARADRRPAFLYNALIRAHAGEGLFVPSLVLYREMLLAGKPHDARGLASVLRACGGIASLRLGRLLHAVAVVTGFSSETAVGNSLLSAYAKCGDIATAQHLFDAMPSKTLVSWTAMVAGLGAHGHSHRAVGLFEEMLGAGERPDAKAVTAVLAACGRGGLVEAGEKLFGEMEERFGVTPAVEHYTCMVDMLGRAGRLEAAEALIEGMEGPPDEVLCGALLAACWAHGKLDLALRVARKLYSRREWSPDHHHLTS